VLDAELLLERGALGGVATEAAVQLDLVASLRAAREDARPSTEADGCQPDLVTHALPFDT
jgi:hypothetical protein